MRPTAPRGFNPFDGRGPFLGNRYIPAGTTLTAEMAEFARCRPEHLRTPIRALPKLNDVIGYRSGPNQQVIAALVIGVPNLTAPGDDPDLNVWRVVLDPESRAPKLDLLGRRRHELVDDPWPVVRLRIGPPPGGVADPERPGGALKGSTTYTDVREERLPGLGGWLPAGAIEFRARWL